MKNVLYKHMLLWYNFQCQGMPDRNGQKRWKHMWLIMKGTLCSAEQLENVSAMPWTIATDYRYSKRAERWWTGDGSLQRA